MDVLQQVLVVLEELSQDLSTPKQVKVKLQATVQLLSSDGERSFKVNKALSELESLAEDVKVQSDIRMQIFNVVSLLEAA